MCTDNHIDIAVIDHKYSSGITSKKYVIFVECRDLNAGIRGNTFYVASIQIFLLQGTVCIKFFDEELRDRRQILLLILTYFWQMFQLCRNQVVGFY